MRLIIATRLFDPEVAAAAFRLKALADGLAAEGHQVTVLTTRPPRSAAAAGAGSYRIHRWPVLRDTNGHVRGYVQYASFDLPLAIRLLVRSADAVVAEPPPTTGVVAALSCMVRRRPFYYYAADIWSDALPAVGVPRVVVATMRALERFAFRRARLVIAVSEEVAERVRELGAAPERIRVVANGVDTGVFHAVPGPAVSEQPYFVYMGTMSEWQGADIFVRALPIVLERYPEVRLRFFGQGVAEGRLRELAAGLVPGHVEFGGVVPPADAAQWLSGASAALVSIIPGRGYDFAKPTKIYAAAACGTLTLFAGRGAGSRLIEDNALGVVAEYTPESVAKKMIQILDGYAHDRGHLIDWVQRHASLAGSGRLATRYIVEDLRGESG